MLHRFYAVYDIDSMLYTIQTICCIRYRLYAVFYIDSILWLLRLAGENYATGQLGINKLIERVATLSQVVKLPGIPPVLS